MGDTNSTPPNRENGALSNQQNKTIHSPISNKTNSSPATNLAYPKRSPIHPDIQNPPPTSLFVIKPTPNKGLAVFATKHLPAGTVFLIEKPLLLITHLEHFEGEPEMLEYLVAQLSPSKRKAYDELHAHYCHPWDSRNMAIWTTNSFQICSEDDGDDDDGNNSNRRESGASFKSKTKNLISNPNDDKVEERVSGVFEIASRINHSHIPNANYWWNEESGVMQFWCGVGEGEEMTIGYGYGRERLKRQWGFECDCVCCVEHECGEVETCANGVLGEGSGSGFEDVENGFEGLRALHEGEWVGY